MTGTVVVHKTQVGQSSTAANNFTIRTLDDGSLRISRGNAGAETSDPLKIEANGDVSLLPTASLNGKNQCTAWVNFNGTGTVTIRDSYNVSSITDNGTGNYTVNFVTPMSRADYSIALGAGGANTTGLPFALANMSPAGAIVPPTTLGFALYIGINGFAGVDSQYVNASVFGGK